MVMRTSAFSRFRVKYVILKPCSDILCCHICSQHPWRRERSSRKSANLPHRFLPSAHSYGAAVSLRSKRKYHCPSCLSSRRREQPTVSKNKIARPFPESPRVLLSLVLSDSKRNVTWSLIFCCDIYHSICYHGIGSRFVTPSCRDSRVMQHSVRR